MTTDNLQKAHRDRHSMAAKLREAREKLTDLNCRHIESVADGQPDVKLAVKVGEAEANLKTLEGAYQLLAKRHVEALRAFAESEAASERERFTELAAQEAPLTHRLNAARVELLSAEGAYQGWKNALGHSKGIVPRPPICVIEGTPAEIRSRVASDPTLLIDPLALEVALATLEGLAKTHGFPDRFGGPGNKSLYLVGKLYMPVLGRCRLTWDANTGKITSQEIIRDGILAIEASAQSGKLEPVPGAVPMPIPQEPQVGVSQFRR